VLINAAAGGLGTLAVQLAQAWGATTVIGTASEANHDYLRSIGAVPVTYGEGLAELVELHDRGALTVHIRRTYPLEQAAEAHCDVNGHGRGKVVLTVS
jgi:NADPH:quinone reductase-like Zn-dependent oxidoreductase